jgi:hypothetical protein
MFESLCSKMNPRPTKRFRQPPERFREEICEIPEYFDNDPNEFCWNEEASISHQQMQQYLVRTVIPTNGFRLERFVSGLQVPQRLLPQTVSFHDDQGMQTSASRFGPQFSFSNQQVLQQSEGLSATDRWPAKQYNRPVQIPKQSNSARKIQKAPKRKGERKTGDVIVHMVFQKPRRI